MTLGEDKRHVFKLSEDSEGALVEKDGLRVRRQTQDEQQEHDYGGV